MILKDTEWYMASIIWTINLKLKANFSRRTELVDLFGEMYQIDNRIVNK